MDSGSSSWHPPAGKPKTVCTLVKKQAIKENLPESGFLKNRPRQKQVSRPAYLVIKGGQVFPASSKP
jgi:hypothetical protein